MGHILGRLLDWYVSVSETMLFSFFSPFLSLRLLFVQIESICKNFQFNTFSYSKYISISLKFTLKKGIRW